MYSLYTSLRLSENERKNAPHSSSAKVLRIASSLHNLYLIYSVFGDRDAAQSKMNERFCDAFRKIYPEISELCNQEALNRLDSLCDELEPDMAFDLNYISAFRRLKGSLTIQEQLRLSENQSSVFAIILNQAAQLGVSESKAAWVVQLVSPIRFALGSILFIFGFYLLILFSMFLENYVAVLVINEWARFIVAISSFCFALWGIFYLMIFLFGRLDSGALRALIWIAKLLSKEH